MQGQDSRLYTQALIAVAKRIQEKRAAGEAYLVVEAGSPDEDAVYHAYVEAVGKYKGAYELTAELFGLQPRCVISSAAAIADEIEAAAEKLRSAQGAAKGGDGDA